MYVLRTQYEGAQGEGQEQRRPLFPSVSSPIAVHRDELLPLRLSAKRPPKEENQDT